MDSRGGKYRKRAIHLLLLEPNSVWQDLLVTWKLETARKFSSDASDSTDNIHSNKSLVE